VTTGSTYDALPYTSLPYPRTHPDHLFAMARLFGVRAAPVETCRVLEIGCGSAGNLLAMAESLPRGRLVGVDPSGGEIERGRAVASQLGLDNLRLVAGTADDVEGTFDYVIAHGVLSWVAPELRRAILARGRALLADDGVFYASYNVFPGWHLRGAVRGMLRHHVTAREPAAQIASARTLIDWLSRRLTRDGGALRAVLDEEIARLASADDAYLFHELLEEDNHPLWFADFVAEAAEAGLSWLGEADPAANVSRMAAPRAYDSLRDIAGDDPIRVEQHFDFLRSRTFRASLLVKQPHVRREAPGEAWSDLFVASRGPGDAYIEDENLAAALARLAAEWPDALPIAELSIDSEGESAGVLAARRPIEPEQLVPLHTASIVELRARRLELARAPLEMPWASPLARLQARGSGMVTNLRHEPLPLSPEERAALVELDGTRSADGPAAIRLAELALLRRRAP